MRLTPFIPKHRVARFAAQVLLALCSLLVHGRAYAGMTCSNTSPNPSSFSFTVPTATYTIPRDVAVGTLLTPWTAWQGNNASVWTGCSFSAGVWYGVALRATLTSSGTTVVTGGNTFTIYPTNLAGVGLIMAWRASVDGSWNTGTPSTAAPSWTMNLNITSSGSGGYFGFAMQFAFVKTGVITPGTVALSGQVAEAGVDSSPSSGPSKIVAINLTGKPTFVVLACTTPDVKVPMGSHASAEFNGSGYTAPVSFNIALNSCPAGMKGIQYRIDPVTSVVNSGQSVVALDSSSSATGVGVQLLDGAGAAFPLSTQKTFSGYNAGTGGSYTIPMKARYYQTGTSVSGGAANTSMTFTMAYQ